MTSKKITLKEQFLCAFSDREGFAAVCNFCIDVQDGRKPDPEFLKKLASAFSGWILEKEAADGMAFFKKELGLEGNPGRITTASEMDNRIVAVVEYRRLRKKKSEGYAADLIAGKYEVGVSTLRKWNEDHDSEVSRLEKDIKLWETNWKNRNTKMK